MGVVSFFSFRFGFAVPFAVPFEFPFAIPFAVPFAVPFAFLSAASFFRLLARMTAAETDFVAFFGFPARVVPFFGSFALPFVLDGTAFAAAAAAAAAVGGGLSSILSLSCVTANDSEEIGLLKVCESLWM